MRLSICLLPLLVMAAPALAGTVGDGSATVASAQAGLLAPADRASYRAAFAAIRTGDFASASATLDALPNGLLTPVARAELALTKGAPAADPSAITTLIAAAPELPEAPALARLARERGVTDVPLLPPQHDLIRFANPSKRLPMRSARADAASSALAAKLQPLFKVNDAVSAEPLIEAAAERLSPEALTEWRQKLAWTYLLANDDADARRVATVARTGTGDWASLADWVLGLASWRAGDMDGASEAFASVASRTRDPEMMAAGLYWAARSDTTGRHPERVEPRLRSAARLNETFYGMLASGILGPDAIEPVGQPIASSAPLIALNARTATALVEIGETALADQMLRQQARIGDPSQHAALITLAGQLNLSATQVWLAQNGPSGATRTAASRYPVPAWTPANGWRVDRALCLAHALQESQLRVDAVSHAGARGLMQLLPTTAQLVARHKGGVSPYAEQLNDPTVSLEYGQSYLEELADNSATQGLLPKVIAAYNAGPNNIAAWNARAGVSQDPLFFIETMPFTETRTYVTTVLRNYWMYQRQIGAATESLTALTAGRWPMFPRTIATSRVASGAAAASGALTN